MALLPARLSDFAADVLLTSVTINDVSEVSPKFVKVSLGCEAFTCAKWTPGDKLQLRPRRGSLAMRTYTPIDWDLDEGMTDVIAYRHGDGPAVHWFNDAEAGADAEVFGPSRSLDLSDTVDNTIFVGDETSVGLAYALNHLNPAVKYLYEASDPDALSAALTALDGTTNTEIIAKTPERSELLAAITEAAEGLSSSCFDLVVTGDAATVSAVRRGLKARPDLTPRVKARAYWAGGRTGLS
jgi:NADPH-dependent ferric siderophore reductase